MMILTALFLFFSSAERQLHTKLSELDDLLPRREVYLNRFNNRMDSLKLELSAAKTDSLDWEIAYQIFSGYSYVNVDSSFRYLEVLEDYATTDELKSRMKAIRIRMYGVKDDRAALESAIGMVSGVDVSKGFRVRFYDELQRAYAREGDDRTNVRIIKKALQLEGLPQDVRSRYTGLVKLYETDYEGALEDFALSYEQSEDYHVKALSAYDLAICYDSLGDDTRYCYWLAQAAIYDLQVPVAEYSSLMELAQALFDKGDYAPASRYIQVVLRDAIDGNWDTRIHLSAANQMAIANALENNERSKRELLLILVLVLVVLIGVIVFFMLSLAKRNTTLHRMNGIMTKMNSKLKDEGRIKESYLFKYMEMSVASIAKVDDYKHQLRQVLKDGGEEALKRMLRKPPVTDNSYKEFYANFDTTFMSLYPDFIKQVNKLMKEAYRFEEVTPLKTDLRILATIRLGFTDSGQIARFLNIPPTSVYTRRSALRRNSVCSREDFEDKIRRLT